MKTRPTKEAEGWLAHMRVGENANQSVINAQDILATLVSETQEHFYTIVPLLS